MRMFARTQGINPAAEAAIRAAMGEVLRYKETGEAKTIQFTLSDHRRFDMAS